VLPTIRVDCANGVGANGIESLAPLISKYLEIKAFNTDTKPNSGKLNHLCGAEYVQKQKKLPEGLPAGGEGLPHCALDGDADRIVFFVPEAKGSFRLQDGDKIATLLAQVFGELMEASGLASGLKLGVVQTAYANGASTEYLVKTLGADRVLCAKTGVKHLHHKAAELDVGIYFEANGHGTVLFSAEALKSIETVEPPTGSEAEKAAKLLRAFVRVINQAIGDALSDLLLVVAALRLKGWSMEKWDGIYTDLPSRMLKAKVRDRTLVITTDAERKCIAPKGLQEKVDSLVAAAGAHARAFVRPSGTEDVVRVYAEAATQAKADELAKNITAEVANFLS